MSPPADNRDDRLRGQAIAHLERLQRDGVWGLDLSASAESSDCGGGGATADETLEQIQAEALECVACRLHESRNKVVFGTGNPRARLLFIGEGPGRDEDLQGEPFVGRAGKLLTKIIMAMGYERQDVYIANVVKCRPPQNRNPQADEADACEHFLLRQVAVIQPQIIVLLGKVAVQAILGSSAPMSRLRGKFQTWRGIPVMCTYHPAYLLRNANAKKDVWEDMQIVRDALAEAEGRE
jgi:uracil-DNA glycosylase family 4